MNTCTIFLVWMMMMMMMMITASELFSSGKASLTGFTSIRAKLNQSATLHCEGQCFTIMKWTMIQKPRQDVKVAQCNQTACSFEEGFLVSYDEYSKGNFSLMITAVTYPRRGWYRSLCDQQEVCKISLRIEPLELNEVIRPGHTIIFNIEVPERLQVLFSNSTDDGHNSDPVSLCTVEGRKTQCDSKYEKRVLFKCSLALRAMKDTDSGVYTLQDTDNEEVLSKLTLAGHHMDSNDTIVVKGEEDSWNLKRIFMEEYRGIIVGFLLCLFFCGGLWVFHYCVCLIKRKMEKSWRDCADRNMEDESDSVQRTELNAFDKGPHRDFGTSDMNNSLL